MDRKEYAFSGIEKAFGKKKVLCGASGAFPAGSFVGILGLNGSGKTTLLDILGNIDRNFRGKVNLRGNAVAYMRTKMPFPESWRVGELFAFCKDFYDFDAERAECMIDNTSVSLKARLRTLSAGMQRQVSFIASFCIRSEVLLLDEPLTNLDLVYRTAIVDSLIERSAEGGTTVVATHEIKEFENLFTNVTVLQKGLLGPLVDAEEIRSRGESIEDFYRGSLL